MCDRVHNQFSRYIPPIDEYLEEKRKMTIQPEKVFGNKRTSDHPNMKVREGFNKDRAVDHIIVDRKHFEKESYRCKDNEHIYIDVKKGVKILVRR